MVCSGRGHSLRGNDSAAVTENWPAQVLLTQFGQGLTVNMIFWNRIFHWYKQRLWVVVTPFIHTFQQLHNPLDSSIGRFPFPSQQDSELPEFFTTHAVWKNHHTTIKPFIFWPQIEHNQVRGHKRTAKNHTRNMLSTSSVKHALHGLG